MKQPSHTYKIRFHNRIDFELVLNMNHLAGDIGHSDMILTYNNKFFRDRFAGYLNTLDIAGLEIL